MKRIILKPGEEGRIKRGHPWVYGNEVETVLADCSRGRGANSGANGGASRACERGAKLVPGECADVESSPARGRKPEYLGRALVNPNSRILARIYSPSKEGLDKGFFKRRIREAAERRAASGYDLSRDSCRVVFGEADFLPGLIVDRYVGADSGLSWLAVQFLAYGMDSRKEMILDALEEALPSCGVVEKSAPVRELEGLDESAGGPAEDATCARGSVPEGGVVIRENGLLFKVDLSRGQKTGHFLDQKDNRRRAARYAAFLSGGDTGGVPFRALDCFCYSGGFAIHAARAAERFFQDAGEAARKPEVTAVDVSAAALELVRENANLNGVSDIIETVESDAFDFLRSAERRKEHYNLIILDPPAFAKNRAALENAARGYKEINLRALKLLSRGGVLVTCSCSHAVDETLFKKIITGAAADAERRIIQLDFRYQALDHPILAGYDESFYLKCGFYRRVV